MAESGKQIISGVMDWSAAAAMAVQLCRRSEWHRWHGRDIEKEQIMIDEQLKDKTSDFWIAVQRLTAWLRDYGHTKAFAFVQDLYAVLHVAQGVERQQAEIERLEAFFRTMRERWFEAHLRPTSHEREWESEEAELSRQLHNNLLRHKFNEQTEAILRGEDYPLTPRCGHDLDTRSYHTQPGRSDNAEDISGGEGD